jgi:molybdopterin molybdotransferase
MITVEKAKDLVNQNINILDSEIVSISNSLGRVLANDVFSMIDIPSFPQSAMDGYAVNAVGDIAKGDSFKVIAEVQAGDTNSYEIQPGEATRIFTGAPMPNGGNTIVIQEIVSVTDDVITVAKSVTFGANLRERGEQIMTGDTGLQAGTLMTPAGIGFLAMMGHDKVKVYRQPIIHVVVTGNELIQPGIDLKHGQIYESNSATLVSAFEQYGYKVAKVHFVKDTYDYTLEALRIALDQADIVITSGGISVGDYDFVGAAFRDLCVNEIFYKVKQKPGKPLFFAKKDDTAVFALPGNPASALTGFYQYVLPSINKMSGLGFEGLKTARLPLIGGYSKKGTRAQFLKGFLTPNGVEILEGQSSAMMHTYAITNALIYIPWDKEETADMEEVCVYLM